MMRNDFVSFVEEKNRRFTTAVFNLFLFLPYYFSVIQLVSTLFHPWKKQIAVKKTAGFSFEELVGRVSFNLISRFVGFFVRLSILVEFLVVQCIFVLFLPVLFLAFVLFLPLSYFLSRLIPSDEKKKNESKEKFVKNHLLKEENRKVVEQWFEVYYANQTKKNIWWQKEALFTTPPIGRNWSSGYTPTLDQYGRELTLPESHHIHLIGRQKEIAQIETLLCKQKSGSVVIVGEEGVGKHTIVEGLAKKIYEGRVNTLLAYKRIIKIDFEKISAQKIDIAQKFDLVKSLFEEASQAGNIIILIDNFEKYISATDGVIDLTITIDGFAKSNTLQFIGITTPFFFEKYIFHNDKINQHFQKVAVFEINQKEALLLLMKTLSEFENRYKIVIPYETLVEVIEKSTFYITAIPFPEKAVALLDDASIYATQIKKEAVVTPEFVDTVLAQKTHIPITLTAGMKEKLVGLEASLKKGVLFQDAALDQLGAAIRKSFLTATQRKKPLGSFLFLGPTGVGKTQTAKMLAQTFFGSQDFLIRFDMSFYQSKEDIGGLIGSADKGTAGLLTSALREHPYGVLLLDEIEKAHPDLLNIFLTLLDEGYFVDGYGTRVDGKNVVVVATSNAAAEFIFEKNLANIPLSQNEFITYLVEKRLFHPEFLNRFDEVIIFQPLSKQAVFAIGKQLLVELKNQMYSLHHVTIDISEQSLTKFIEEGYSPQFGVRNLKRVIRNQIEDKIAKLLLTNQVKEGESITI